MWVVIYVEIHPLKSMFDHGGALDIRGRRDFSRFDPSPGEAPLFIKSGPSVEAGAKTFMLYPFGGSTFHYYEYVSKVRVVRSRLFTLVRVV